MNFKTKIALAFILTILLSCSSETNDDIASIDNEIVKITPDYGYEGDEITFEMSNLISDNSRVSITYNQQSAEVSEINGKIIKHIIPDNHLNSGPELTINEQGIYRSKTFSILQKYIDCENCREKVFSSNSYKEGITSVFKNNNYVYSIKLSRNIDGTNQKTTLIKTDLDYKIITETILFNGYPSSNILIENNGFILKYNKELFSYDLNGNVIWSYKTNHSSSSIDESSKPSNSLIKFNSYYYLIDNFGYYISDTNQSIELLKLNNNGQLISTINIPIQDSINYYGQSCKFLDIVDNKIVVINQLNPKTQNSSTKGYFVIDSQDNIIKSNFFINDSMFREWGVFVNTNSIYFQINNGTTQNPNINLVKISLDSDNNFLKDWTKDETGVIAKKNNKYFMFQKDKILIFNDDDFNSPSVFDTSLRKDAFWINANIYNNEIYLNGSRTVRTANDYHALIGKYDLNHITN
ncbi:hypothetical protein [Tenacibaculum finnmarkense]|uniref:hypothetical protein n=1 Tax=Tenacibaculum finnmarkense TaxID=2781243 RepID=UPI001EFA3E7D|nr:hypothetical protein [Tenacibaculum finnmarkense]MCG8750512.1 hypothetical protein [Tenacibaculum finnmarkense]